MSDDKTTNTNDAQAEALIAALAPKIAEAIIPKLAEQVETQIKGVIAKNDELLDKLHNMKKDAEIEESGRKLESLTAAAAKLTSNDDTTPKPMTFERSAPVQISRTDARDVQKYRAAKAEAEKQGVDLEIVAGQ